MLALVLTAGVISLITGRNKRQIARIPEGMGIVCQPPGKRYVMYALGVVVVVFVEFSVSFTSWMGHRKMPDLCGGCAWRWQF